MIKRLMIAMVIAMSFANAINVETMVNETLSGNVSTMGQDKIDEYYGEIVGNIDDMDKVDIMGEGTFEDVNSDDMFTALDVLKPYTSDVVLYGDPYSELPFKSNVDMYEGITYLNGEMIESYVAYDAELISAVVNKVSLRKVDKVNGSLVVVFVMDGKGRLLEMKMEDGSFEADIGGTIYNIESLPNGILIESLNAPDEVFWDDNDFKADGDVLGDTLRNL